MVAYVQIDLSTYQFSGNLKGVESIPPPPSGPYDTKKTWTWEG